MSERVRLNLQVSSDLNDALEKIAGDSGTTKTEVIRHALALMKVAHAAKNTGRHIGIVRDATKLDTEIVGLI